MHPGFVSAVASLALAGCAQLTGIDDPVALHEVPNGIGGDYLAGVALPAAVVRFHVVVSTPDEDREVTTAWQAFAEAGEDVVGETFEFAGLELENQPELDFAIEPFVVEVPEEAIAGDAPMVIESTLAGSFPILDGDTPTTDAFCGTLATGATFAAIKVELGTGLPPPRTSCADL